MWNRGIRRAERRRQGARRRDGGPGPARVPRATTRPAWRSSTATTSRPASAPASWPTSSPRSRHDPLPGVQHRHRAHPLGHPRRAHRRQRPPAPRWRRRQARPDPQRHHRELPRPQGRPAGRRGDVHCPRPTPRSWPSCWPAAYDETGDLTEAMREVVGGLEGAFTLLAVHADQPGVVVGARRNSPLVVGLGDGENFLGSDVAAFIGHTRDALELGQDQIVTITPDGATVIDFDGTPAEGKRVPRRLGRRGRREGRLRDLHGEGDPRPAARRRPTPCSGAPTRPAGWSSTSCASPRSDLRSVDKIVIVACGTAAYAGMVAKYAIEHWTRIPVRGRARPRVPLPRPGRQRAHARRLDQPVRRDDGHPDGGQARPRARRADHLHLQHPRLDDPARVRRRALHPRRPRDRRRLDQGVPRPDHRLLRPRALPRPAARRHLRRRRAGGHEGAARASRPRSRRVLGQMDRVKEIARFMADTRSVLFLGRHVGYPVAMEGALKLKELAYIHAEGFAAGELKHGPIALIEPGQPVFVVVPVARQRARPARQGRLQHPGDPRPRRPHPRHRRGGRRGRRPVRRRGDPGPRDVAAARAAAHRRAAAGLRPASWPRPRAWTSTSRATWPSRSRSSERAPVIIGVGIDVVDIARFGQTLERTPALRERLFTDRGARPRARLPGRPVRRQGGPGQGARRAGRPALDRRHGACADADGRPHLQVARHRAGPRRRPRRARRCTCPCPTTPGIASAVVIAEG